MAGFSEGDRVLHGLAIANFADHDHIRGLPQRVLQRRFPALCVHTHFAVGHDAVAVRMHELHRVFNGHDMTMRMFVAMTDHRSQRRRFA